MLRMLRGAVVLSDLTAVLAERHGDRPAVDDPAPTPGLHPGGTRTFAQVEEHVGVLAAALRDLEVPGDARVAIAIGNRIDIVLLALAAHRAGAIPVPVNPRLTPEERAAVATAAGLDIVVADDPDGWPEGLRVVTADTLGEAAATLAAAGTALPPAGGDPEAVALLMTTSGTTGVPKAAALTSHGLLGGVGLLSLLPVGTQRGLRAGRDRVFACLPLTHVMGLSVALASWVAGVPLLRRERFDAAEALALIARERPNVVVAVPTMYADLEAAGAAEADLRSVQLWVSGADVMPLDRMRRFQQHGAMGRALGRPFGAAGFVDAYGMVELSGPAAVRVLPPSPVGLVPVPAVALALPGFEVRAVDADGRAVRTGTTGELQFRGPGVLRRYEGRPDAGPDADGWLATGDHGRVFRGGLFQFAGRSRDRLKVGGFSVFPAEVEHELRDAPGVTELAIVGVPDDRLGERLVAVVVAAPTFDADAFLDWAHGTVAGYRRPHDVVVVEAIPRGNHGKIDRAGATALAVTAQS